MSSILRSSGRPVEVAASNVSKVAIVTGASSGIGLDVVRRLIASGYSVVASSRNITSANTVDGTGHLKLVDGDIGIRETAQWRRQPA